MIRTLPARHPAQGLRLDVPVADELGRSTTLAALEERAADHPSFANVRALYAALDKTYPDWRGNA